jgi:hypothetical protein
MNAAVATTTARARQPHARRRRLWRWLLGLFLAFLVAGGYFAYARWAAEDRLQRVMAELDAREPGWRLEDILAHRPAISPEQNSALRVLAAMNLNGIGWKSGEEQQFDAARLGLSPACRLSEQQAAVLRRALKSAEPALAVARELADLPAGRFETTYGPDGFPKSMAHLQQARALVNRLKYWTLLQCEDGDIDGALASVRAMVNAGRSLADEPFMPAQLTQLACRGVALCILERALAQGEPSKGALIVLQRLLEDEESQPVLLVAARGSRAGAERILRALRAGEVKLSDVAGRLGKPMTGVTLGIPKLNDMVYAAYFRVTWTNEAALLEYDTRLVEIAKLPIEQQLAAIKELEGTLNSQPLPVRALQSSMGRMGNSFMRYQSQLRCAIAAVALERYRQANGRWPDSLTSLGPELLREVPADPYDGMHLRYRRLNDRVVVYSVGADNQDNGGNVTWGINSAGTDLGMYLWNVELRRQPHPKPSDIRQAR